MKRLENLRDAHGFHLAAVDTGTKVDKALAAPEFAGLSTTTFTATLRIDDDDALARDFLSTMRLHVPVDGDDVIISRPEGVYLSDHGAGNFTFGRFRKRLQSCGIARVRRGQGLVPSIHGAGNHVLLDRSFKVIEIPGRDAFLMTAHHDNVSARDYQPQEAPLTEADCAWLAERFGVTVSVRIETADLSDSAELAKAPSNA